MPSRRSGSPADSAFYRPELDGLRFVAFLAVFVHHYLPKGGAFYERRVHLPPAAAAWASSVATVGALGVDLFFVLSSYLITSLLLRERRARGDVDVGAFYMRRGLRIWPLFFSYLALVLVLSRFDEAIVLPLASAGWFALFLGNWLPDLDLLTPLVVPLWSVCFEEQFYACWPWVARRLSPRGLLWFCASLVVVSMSARALLSSHQVHHPIWFITVARLEPIAAGGALGVLLETLSWRPSTLGRIGLAVGAAAGALFSIHVLRILEPEATRAALVFGYLLAAMSATAIFMAVHGARDAVLATPAVAYLGRISYGLYVWHELALYVGRRVVTSWHVTASGFVLFGAASLSLAVALAAISYHGLEMPFLRLKKRFTYIQSGALGQEAPPGGAPGAS